MPLIARADRSQEELLQHILCSDGGLSLHAPSVASTQRSSGTARALNSSTSSVPAHDSFVPTAFPDGH